MTEPTPTSPTPTAVPWTPNMVTAPAPTSAPPAHAMPSAAVPAPVPMPNIAPTHAPVAQPAQPAMAAPAQHPQYQSQPHVSQAPHMMHSQAQRQQGQLQGHVQTQTQVQGQPPAHMSLRQQMTQQQAVPSQPHMPPQQASMQAQQHLPQHIQQQPHMAGYPAQQLQGQVQGQVLGQIPGAPQLQQQAQMAMADVAEKPKSLIGKLLKRSPKPVMAAQQMMDSAPSLAAVAAAPAVVRSSGSLINKNFVLGAVTGLLIGAFLPVLIDRVSGGTDPVQAQASTSTATLGQAWKPAEVPAEGEAFLDQTLNAVKPQ